MKLILTKWKQNIGAFGFEDNQLVEANIFDSMQEICVGDIYLGRVNKVLPNINAYFVKIGVTEIFLPFSETDKTYKSGDNILIQIKKSHQKVNSLWGRRVYPLQVCIVLLVTNLILLKYLQNLILHRESIGKKN